MVIITNLRGERLAAKACGRCQGSSNDAKIRIPRTANEEQPQEQKP